MKLTSTKGLLLLLGSIVFVFVAFVLRSPFQNTTDDSVSEFREVAWTSHLTAVEKVGDTEFTNFVESNLEKVCPFYEPDGASYRECLSEYVLTKQPNSEIEESCRKVVSDYGGVEAQNLYLSCLAYFLPRHTF